MHMAHHMAGRTIAILAEDLYEDTELWYPYYRLVEAGADVKIVGSGRAESFTSKHGYRAFADLSIDTTSAVEFDGVVIPGGYSPDLMRRKPAMVDFVREIDKSGKPVAAICHAGWMLISAGIVAGRRATCHFAIKDDLVAAGAQYVDEAVVIDGNLVTSRIPADLPQFVPAFIDAFALTAALT
jgi:protease I